MQRIVRIIALVLMILAVIGVVETPLTKSKVAFADGGGPMPLCDPGTPGCTFTGKPTPPKK